MNWLEYERRRNPMPAPLVLPVRYQAITDTDLWRGPLRECATEYVARFAELAVVGRAPLFLGRARTGKTLTAAWIARQVASIVSTQFCSVPVQFPAWEMNRFAPQTEEQIAGVSRVPFLVLDDIGIIRKNSFGHQSLIRVIAARFDAQRPTLFTGNLDLPEGQEWATVEEQYGPLVQRRLQEASEGFSILLS